jgi:hypothetical protein
MIRGNFVKFQVFAIESGTGRKRMICGTFSAKETQVLRGAVSSGRATIEIVGPDGPLTPARLDQFVAACANRSLV